MQAEKEFYERYWRGELPKMLLFGEAPRWEKKWLERYTKFVNTWSKPEHKLMDYGCGEGHFLNYINRPLISCGIDISEEAIARAKLLYPQNCFYYIDQEIDQITLADHFWDTITCFDVMEHIFDFDEVFKYFDRMLKPGGRLIIATNEMCFLKMVAIGLLYMDTFFHPYSPHIRFFTKNTLEDLLNEKGYEVIHYERVANHYGFLSTGQLVVAERI